MGECAAVLMLLAGKPAATRPRAKPSNPRLLLWERKIPMSERIMAANPRHNAAGIMTIKPILRFHRCHLYPGPAANRTSTPRIPSQQPMAAAFEVSGLDPD